MLAPLSRFVKHNQQAILVAGVVVLSATLVFAIVFLVFNYSQPEALEFNYE